jgi:hypothetical protein
MISFSSKGVIVEPHDKEIFLSWESLDEMRNAFRFENKVLVKVEFSYGRVSDMYDHAIYGKDEWAKIKQALQGTTAYYSDFAGKHSQTEVTFWDNVTLTEITDIKEIIAFNALNGYSDSNLDIISEGITQGIENGLFDEEYNSLVL